MDVTDPDQLVIVTVEEIIAACQSMAGSPYDGEPVDQLEHALQCASLARDSGGDRDFVIAALLHDIARATAVAGIPFDGPREHHGEIAARWLTPRVGAQIAWLAEQHVPGQALSRGNRRQLPRTVNRGLGPHPACAGRPDERRRGGGFPTSAGLATGRATARSR